MQLSPYHLYEAAGLLRDRAFSRLLAREFEAFGPGSVLRLPVRLHGAPRISVGTSVILQAGCWLNAIGEGRIDIGAGTTSSGLLVISAAQSVVVERGVLFARNVHVVDHQHDNADDGVPIAVQGVRAVAPVRIGEGAWIGANAVILPGASIGRNAVIGANSVVAGEVPDFAVAVGAPARVIVSPKLQREPEVGPAAIGGVG